MAVSLLMERMLDSRRNVHKLYYDIRDFLSTREYEIWRFWLYRKLLQTNSTISTVKGSHLKVSVIDFSDVSLQIVFKRILETYSFVRRRRDKNSSSN